MKRELGIARCGLACCLCSENGHCSGCNSGECRDKASCKNRKCSIDHGYSHCYECSEDCKKGLLAKIKPYGFSVFARRYGEEALLDCLERNEHAGVVYHRKGITGDYDDFDDIEDLIAFIRTGKKSLTKGLLNQSGFDLWADGYDKSVSLSDDENTYPFAGYKAVLGTIYQTIMEKPNAIVLDIGFGTGTLTAKLYENGCTIYRQDFSARMLELASEKMPTAQLYQGDFAQGLVSPLLERRYDFIVATYALHHLTDEQKASFLRMLLRLLNPGGQILIGDVAFETRSQLETCRMNTGDKWDEDEYYFIADELKKDFPSLVFTRISFCAGILSLNK